MKRFYCSKCDRTIRVHRLPINLSVQPGVKFPVGTCRWHTQGPRAFAMNRVRVVARLGSTRKISATSQKSKSK